MKSRFSLNVWYIWLVYILASHLLISLDSCALACILASLHSHILMFVCTCLHPRILRSSYLQVHMPCLHHCILISSGSCVLACILAFLHPHNLRFISVSFYTRILGSSYPQIHVYFYASMLTSSGQCVLYTSSSIVLGSYASQCVNNSQIVQIEQAFVLEFCCTRLENLWETAIERQSEKMLLLKSRQNLWKVPVKKPIF